MSTRPEALLNEFLEDWTREGQTVTADIRARFVKLADLAEQVILDGGNPLVMQAYTDAVKLEMASGALAAERSAREAFNRTATRAIRWIVAVVAA